MSTFCSHAVLVGGPRTGEPGRCRFGRNLFRPTGTREATVASSAAEGLDRGHALVADLSMSSAEAWLYDNKAWAGYSV